MSCSNFYDWVFQSMEHQHFANSRYPLLAELASTASSIGDFESIKRDLEPGEAVQAESEKNRWYREYGHEWGVNNCVNESYVGESGETGESTFTPGKSDPTTEDIKDIQNALRRSGYDPGKVDGKWGPKTCGAAYRFKIERLKDYNKDLDWNFFAQLGFSGQDGQDFVTKFGTICRPYYKDYVKETSSDVEAIQAAMIRKGLIRNASGKFDEVTCKALFKFQASVFGDSKKGMLDKETFIALGFAPLVAGTYASLYGMKCQGFYGGDMDIPDEKPPRPTPGDDVDVVEPQPQTTKKAGIPLLLGILGIGAAIGGVFYARKNK